MHGAQTAPFCPCSRGLSQAKEPASVNGAADAGWHRLQQPWPRCPGLSRQKESRRGARERKGTRGQGKRGLFPFPWGSARHAIVLQRSSGAGVGACACALALGWGILLQLLSAVLAVGLAAFQLAVPMPPAENTSNTNHDPWRQDLTQQELMSHLRIMHSTHCSNCIARMRALFTVCYFQRVWGRPQYWAGPPPHIVGLHNSWRYIEQLSGVALL